MVGLPFDTTASAPGATFATRPVVMGTRGVVTSGHYLATAAGFRIMEQGGNAFDAAAAMCFCVNLLEPQSNGIGGEVPVLVYSANENKVFSISGMGWSPQGFTIDWCRENGLDMIPGDGHLPACVPAVVGTWATILSRFGTMSFSQILQPAIELSENGFPVYEGLSHSIQTNLKRFTDLYPTTRDVFCSDGNAPQPGEVFRNPDWAETLKILCRAEDSQKHRGRIKGIDAARDAFYKGEIAEKIAKFISDNPVEDATGESHHGLLSYDDIAEWDAVVEEPVSFNYRGLEVHKCGPWTQGPVFLQQLGILQGFDLKKLGHNTSEYIHILIETAKLAFADREAYYGDPDFDDVPLERLLSDGYSDERRNLIADAASTEIRPGDLGMDIPFSVEDVLADNRSALDIESGAMKDLGLGHAHTGDTTHLDAVDREGNMVSATPSGGWFSHSPVIKGLGFPISVRGQMFYLNARRANALAPRKRPRTTLTPSLVTKNGDPWMVFGTPGGDTQDQITLQFFLNHVDFGMDIQQSLDAPTVYSVHFPSSFYPRASYPGRMVVEGGIDRDVIEQLIGRGHEVLESDPWSHGKVMGIRYDKKTGVISGGASPRKSIAYAFGW